MIGYATPGPNGLPRVGASYDALPADRGEKLRLFFAI